MEKIYVPYVIYKENSGFFSETKFYADIDINEFIQNKGIVTSFYGDEIKVECLNGIVSEKGNNILFTDGILLEITQEDIVKKITDLFIKLSYEAINAKYMDYKRDEKDISIAENIAVMLNNFGYKVDLNEKNDFNEDNYLKLAKELSLYTQIYMPNLNKEINPYIHEIRKITRALNTTLAVNDVLNFNPSDDLGKQFNVDRYEDADGVLIDRFKYSSSEFFDARSFRPLKDLKKTNKLKSTF